MSLSEIIEGVIYKITNNINNKVYIGSTMSGLVKRKRVHLTNLLKNKHHSKKLQNSFNKHGIDCFIFEIIEKCSNKIILEREQYWLDYLDSYNKGYNCTPIAGNCEGRPVSQETRNKISKSLQGRKIVRTHEHNMKLGELRRKPVYQYDLSGNFIRRYKSTTEAGELSGVSQSCISVSCTKDIPKMGFVFKFNSYENTTSH